MSIIADELPRYRVTRDVHPSPNPRFKFEPPFSQIMDNDEWQQADRVYKAREEITTLEWPHPSFRGLNESAQKILEFFTASMKSRLPRSPFTSDGRLRLDTGLSGPTHPDVRPPRPEPFNLRPVA